MIALESAGVGSWDGYAAALEEIKKKKEIDENITHAVNEALYVLEESLHDSGFGVDTTKEAQNDALNILKACIDNIILNYNK